MFLKSSFLRVVKRWDCVVKSYQANIVKRTLLNTCTDQNKAGSEILEFPSVINFDIITSDDINFHFHFLPLFRNYFFFIKHL